LNVISLTFEVVMLPPWLVRNDKPETDVAIVTKI